MYDKLLLTNMEFETLLQECISGYGPMNLDYLARSVEFTAQVLAETHVQNLKRQACTEP